MLFSTDPNHPACHFNRAELLALLTCSGKDEARVNLNTVFLDPAVRSAVVTDGHRMLIATETPPAAKGAKVTAAAGPSVVLRRTDVESWAKAAKAYEQIRIEWSDGTVTAIASLGPGSDPRLPMDVASRGDRVLLAGDAMDPESAEALAWALLRAASRARTEAAARA